MEKVNIYRSKESVARLTIDRAIVRRSRWLCSKQERKKDRNKKGFKPSLCLEIHFHSIERSRREETMDHHKFRTLVEYRSEGSGQLKAVQLLEVCRNFLDLGDAPVEGLEAACKALLGSAESRASDAIIEEVVEAKTDAGKVLQKLLMENVKVQEAKPISSTLSTLVGADLADDEDDDEEEVEETEENANKSKSESIEAQLRGTFKIKGDKLLWSGNWVTSADDWNDENKKSKFKYHYVGDKKKLKASKPPSGLYQGYFMLKNSGEDEPDKKVIEKKIKLRFSRDDDDDDNVKFMQVSGEGSNSFGKFKLDGVFDRSKGRASVRKIYEPTSNEFGDGDDDDDDSVFDEDQEAERRADMASELEDLRKDAASDIVELKRKMAEKVREESNKRQKTG